MNKEWSDLNKLFQTQIKKEFTFYDGIKTLLKLRNSLFDELIKLKGELTIEEFSSMPFSNVNSYHSKTIAYSIWHIFRIEDIVSNSLINNANEIISTYKAKISSPIITTGNELDKDQIVDFSNQLNIGELYKYAKEVKTNTDKMLRNLSFIDLKQSFNNNDKVRIKKLNVVSADEKAAWLIDYWCNKNVAELLKMPFSRHWIMHIEACERIKNKLIKERKNARKNVK